MSDFLLADGFGNLSDGTHTAGTTREILGDQWASYAANLVVADIGDGRKWMRSAAAGRYNLRSGSLFGDVQTIAIAFRVFRGSTAHVALPLFQDKNDSDIVSVGINSAGNLVLGTDNTYNGSQNSAVHPSDGTIPENTETHVEVRITAAAGATGAVAYYINGVLDKAYANVATIRSGGHASFRSLRFGWDQRGTTNFAMPTTWKYTDVVVHVGASPLGDAGVFYIPPDEDGADDDFTPSAGADHFAMVDEIGPDGDTTYNESDGTAGHRDSLKTPGISDVAILSVAPLVRARKTDAGTGKLLIGAVHGASETQGGEIGLSEEYLTYVEWIDDCPGSAGWSTAQLAAAELSYEIGA